MAWRISLKKGGVVVGGGREGGKEGADQTGCVVRKWVQGGLRTGGWVNRQKKREELSKAHGKQKKRGEKKEGEEG